MGGEAPAPQSCAGQHRGAFPSTKTPASCTHPCELARHDSTRSVFRGPLRADSRGWGRVARGGRSTGFRAARPRLRLRSEEHTSELQSLAYLVCRLLLEKKKRDTIKPSSSA